MKYFSIVLLAIAIIGCKSKTKKEVLSADDIINQSIEVSGGNAFSKSDIQFTFRDKFYSAKRNFGDFEFTRAFKTDNDSIFDILSNHGFERHINDKEHVFVHDSMIPKYSASVNSVHYFSVLPYGLNDAAVNKVVLGTERIKGEDYYKIKVTFNEEGGGEDFEDEFIYWVNQHSFKVNYLAYSYNEDDGKGLRFREAYNERFINGIRFVDYNNYKPKASDSNLLELGTLFQKDNLTLLSKIELKDVDVDLINDY